MSAAAERFCCIARPNGTPETPEVEVFFPWKDGNTMQRGARMLEWIAEREHYALPCWRVILCPLTCSMALFEVTWHTWKPGGAA